MSIQLRLQYAHILCSQFWDDVYCDVDVVVEKHRCRRPPIELLVRCQEGIHLCAHRKYEKMIHLASRLELKEKKKQCLVYGFTVAARRHVVHGRE